MIERPEAIVITFPVNFLLDLSYTTSLSDKIEESHMVLFDGKKDHIKRGYKLLLNQLTEIERNPDTSHWWHSMGTKPQYEVLWAYVTVLGKIIGRFNVVEFSEGGDKYFEDGRKRTAKVWLLLSNYISAPQQIPFKGCQGFRYSKKLF